MEEKKLALVFQFFTEIGIINQLSVAQLEKHLPLGIKVSQFSVLNHFVRLGDGVSPVQLASAFQVTKGAMTNNLSRLLKHELISIVPDERDGRAKRVYITERGKQVREDSVRVLFTYMQPMLKQISLAEFEAALPFLMKVRSYLDNHRS